MTRPPASVRLAAPNHLAPSDLAPSDLASSDLAPSAAAQRAPVPDGPDPDASGPNAPGRRHPKPGAAGMALEPIPAPPAPPAPRRPEWPRPAGPPPGPTPERVQRAAGPLSGAPNARAAALASLLALAWPAAAAAVSLDLPPGSALAFADTLAPGSHALATAPFAEGALPLAPREGRVTRQVWQVPLAAPGTPPEPPEGLPADSPPDRVPGVPPGPSASDAALPPPATTLALLQPLRAQLEAQGLAILLDCEARACGGFDFRAGVEVLPPPAMFVDLGDFRYLSAQGEGSALSLLVSRSGTTGFVQAIEVGPAPRRAVAGAPVEGPTPPGPLSGPPSGPGAPAPPEAGAPTGIPAADPPGGPPGAPPPAALPAPALPADVTPPHASPAAPGGVPAAALPAMPAALGPRLEAEGRVVLEGLAFASGSAELASGGAAALDALAAWLAQDPARRVVLVGHTDATGPLDANLALSRRRAQAVAARLEAAPGVSPAQVEASGAGFLAPRATNLTPEGRDANRRVEAVALPPG